MMTTEQIEQFQNSVNLFKHECLRVLSYFKDLEGCESIYYNIFPDYCVIIPDDEPYVYCEEIDIGGEIKGCTFDLKYLTYTDTQLREYVTEENYRYHKLQEERDKKRQNRTPIPIDKAMKILSDTNMTK